jgi:hypothetical protein
MSLRFIDKRTKKQKQKTTFFMTVAKKGLFLSASGSGAK